MNREEQIDESWTQEEADGTELLLESGAVEAEIEERERLTPHQRKMVFAAGLLSFLFFFLILFPYEIVLRSILAGSARTVGIEYSTLDFHLFRPTEVTGLQIRLPDGSTFRSDNARIDMSLIGLLMGRASGTLEISGFHAAMAEATLSAGTVGLDLNLKGIRGLLPDLSGRVELRASRVVLVRLNLPFPLPVSPEDLKVERLFLKTTGEKGLFRLEDVRIQSNLVRVQSTGNIRMTGSTLASALLDGRVCLDPSEHLQEESPSVYGLYSMASGGTAGHLCFRAKGALRSPSFEKEEGAP